MSYDRVTFLIAWELQLVRGLEQVNLGGLRRLNIGTILGRYDRLPSAFLGQRIATVKPQRAKRKQAQASIIFNARNIYLLIIFQKDVTVNCYYKIYDLRRWQNLEVVGGITSGLG